MAFYSSSKLEFTTNLSYAMAVRDILRIKDRSKLNIKQLPDTIAFPQWLEIPTDLSLRDQSTKIYYPLQIDIVRSKRPFNTEGKTGYI